MAIIYYKYLYLYLYKYNLTSELPFKALEKTLNTIYFVVVYFK